MGEEGMKMSMYGKSWLNPQEKAGLLNNVLRRTGYITAKHPAIVGVSDAPHLFPGIKTWSRHEIEDGLKQGMYFGRRTRPTLADVRPAYERLFNSSRDYDYKMHRDDRKSLHRIGCAIREEETKRHIPLLGNSTYGHRLKKPLETFSRTHVQIEHVQTGFYYARGTGLPATNTR